LSVLRSTGAEPEELAPVPDLEVLLICVLPPLAVVLLLIMRFSGSAPLQRTAVRLTSFLSLAMWPVLGLLVVAVVAYASLSERDPTAADLKDTALLTGVGVIAWLAFVAYECLRYRNLGQFNIVDTSLSPVPLPADLAPLETELVRLGFSRLGQYEVVTAWPEKAPRVYSQFTSSALPGVSAEISHKTRRASFGSCWADGNVIETHYTPTDRLPSVPLPSWLMALNSSESIEVAHQLHLKAIDDYARVAGPPVAIPDLPTLIEIQADGMRRMHRFYRATLWVPLATILFVVPAWLALTWFAFTG
jgi:hypothetical protein